MTSDTTLTTVGAGRTIRLAAFWWSLTAVPIGLWQLLWPDAGPFTGENRVPTIPMPDSLPDATAPVLLIAAGAAGLLLARATPRLWPLTALFAFVFGLLVPSMHLLSLAGYLCAFVLPIVLICGPVLLAKGRVATVVAAAAVVAGLTLLLTGPLPPSALAELGRELGGGLLDVGVYPLAEMWAAAGGALWAVLTLRLTGARRADGSAPAWLAPERAARWGKVAAVVAFACCLPYGLSRLTWFTPWPYLVSAEELAAEPGLRLWGLLLGGAALGGGVLCLGLVQRWGERWPYWVPVLRGRPVPARFAIVPASLVAYLFTISGVSLLSIGLRDGEPLMVLLFPMYVWGPALAAATLAYAIRRGAVRVSR